MSTREFLQRNYDNEVKLKQFSELIWLFFKKKFLYNRNSSEFFNQDYRWTHQDYCNATYHEMSMQGIIDNDKYLIERNESECFFAFTYGEYST